MEHWPCFGVDANIGRWAFCYPAAQEDVALLLEQVGLLVIVPVLGRTLGMLPISGQEGGQCCSVPGALSPGKVLKARGGTTQCPAQRAAARSPRLIQHMCFAI